MLVQDTQHVDTSSGPVAVLRNLKALFQPGSIDLNQKRVVITDREYTSVLLSVKLLEMGFYNIGTIQHTRLGFPRDVVFKFKTVPKHIARGTCRLMRCLPIPDIFAYSWIDRKPVYISSGLHKTNHGSTEITEW